MKWVVTFKKYLFGLPSGCMVDILAVFAQADTLDESAERIFVPGGIAAKP